MRIGARDPNTGKAGTVFYDVTVPDFAKDPLAMSGLLLSSLPGTAAADVLTPQRDPEAEKLLGAPATSRRDFSQCRDAVVADRDLRQHSGQAAEAVDMSARLIDEAGREAFASRDVLTNGEGGAPKWPAFGYTGRIPLKRSRPADICCGSKRIDRSTASKEPAAAQTVITVR